MDIYELADILSSKTGLPVASNNGANIRFSVTIPYIYKRKEISVDYFGDDEVKVTLEIGKIDNSLENYELMNKLASQFGIKYYINFMGTLIISCNFKMVDFNSTTLSMIAAHMRIMSGDVTDTYSNYNYYYRLLVKNCY